MSINKIKPPEFYRKKLLNIINSIRGKNKTDCLVAFSGGKDSAYLLYTLKKEYGLNIMAYSLDTGFLSEIAMNNIAAITKKLEIPLIFEKPQKTIFNKIYSCLLRYPSSTTKVELICDICSSIYESGAIICACRLNIPLVVLGFSPYQQNEFIFEMPKKMLKKGWFMKDMEPLGLTEQEKSFFWNPELHKKGNLPRVIVPFHALKYDYDEIISLIKKEKLIEEGNESPIVTNCRINDIMMFFDKRRFGFNPYFSEFSLMLKNRAISETQFKLLFDRLNKTEKNEDYRLRIEYTLKELGIKEEEIKYK